METRASYALIGASMIAGLIALIAFVLWLGHVQFNRTFALYDVAFEGAVNGLSQGGQVRYLGINVGEVTDLSLDAQDPNRVIARIRINAETPVRVDSKAILDFAGLTGVTFIQIQPGTAGAALLPKRTGNDIPVIETELTQLAEIFEGGQDLLANAQITLARLNTLLDEENTTNLKDTLRNIELITGAFADDEQLLENASDALGSLSRAAQAVGDAAESFSGLGTDARGTLSELSVSAQKVLEDASRAVASAEQAIGNTEASFGNTLASIEEPTVDAVDEVQMMAQDLRLLIRRLDRIARDVEQNPQAFIQGSPKPYKDEK